METTEIKETVKKAYTKVLTEKDSSCCGPECCGTGESMADDYTNLDGYVAEADYGLGCGTPTQFADIKEGDTVLDLGTGAGNDAFIASKIVGKKGKVIGLDMTEAMINKANDNKIKLGFNNVEFIFGEIEDMPVKRNSIDVVISNCVLNLVPDKSKAFNEIYRVLKSDGHFTISDIVVSGNIPEQIKNVAELYAGCISGAMNKDDYIKTIKESGFRDVKILKEKIIDISDELMLKYLSPDDLNQHKKSRSAIVSVTVFGKK